MTPSLNLPFLAASLFAIATTSQGTVLTPNNLTDWANSVNAISSDIRLEDFSGFVNGTEIGSVERGPGIVFRPFEGLSIYPRVDNDSAFGGGWLVNRNNPGFDEFQDGFVFDFTEPTFAVSLNDNPNEAVRLRIYNSADTLIGETSNGTGVNFLGIVSTSEQIAYATVINLQPEDGIFAIDNLRIGVGLIPEPSSAAFIVGLIGLAGVAQHRQRT